MIPIASQTRHGLVLGSRCVGFLDRAAGRLNQLRRRLGALETKRGAVSSHREAGDETVLTQRAAICRVVILGNRNGPAALDLVLEILRRSLESQVLAGDVRDAERTQPSQYPTAAAGIAQQAYAAGQGEAGAAGGASAAPGGEGPAPGGKDNVVDAEFEEVKDKDSGKDQRAS